MKSLKCHIYKLLIVPFLLNGVGAFAQNSFTDTLRAVFTKQGPLLVQEKVYVQTDKVFYATGETIWFKVYVVDASFHESMDASKVVYLELLSAEQKAVQQLKVELQNGFGDGYIEIPVSLVSGNYRLRAYTNWMKNFSAEFYFEKNISIINPSRSVATAQSAGGPQIIQFFPEGGNLVLGLESKIGFAVKNNKGMGVLLNGAVINQTSDTVAKFYAFKFGLGNFTFTPMPGNAYKAVCYWSDGSASIHDLPTVFDKGFVMRMEELGGELVFKVRRRGLENDRQIYLLVQSRQQVRIASVKRLTGDVTSFTIEKSELPEGISQITLFNESRQPICERLFFKQPKDTTVFRLQTASQFFHRREKVDVSISAFDGINKAIAGNSSISVYLLDSLQKNDQALITSYLYLTSDLAGRVDSPNYYLSRSSPEVDQATENLMLTHGWRRFDWNELLYSRTPAFDYLPEVGGHIINARVMDKSGAMTPKGIMTYLSVPGEKYAFVTALTDGNGKLRFETNRIYGAGELVAQTNYEKDSNYRIDLINPFSEEFSAKAIPPLQLQRTWEKQLASLSTASQVSHVYAKDQSLQFILPDLPDSTAFYGAPDNKYFLDDYTRFTTMEEVLREYVEEVQVRRTRDKYNLRLLNTPYKSFFESNPLVLLDGVPIFDMNKVIALDPLKIKKLEIISRKFYQGGSVYPGIVSFSTYQGDLGGYDLDPNAIIVRYDGLQIRREFYSPVYETAEQKQSRLPDFRTTLYWSPTVRLTNQSTSTVQFSTSDIPGTYLMVIEGLSTEGKPGTGQLMFTVTK